jgi:hypothetical protein
MSPEELTTNLVDIDSLLITKCKADIMSSRVPSPNLAHPTSSLKRKGVIALLRET